MNATSLQVEFGHQILQLRDVYLDLPVYTNSVYKKFTCIEVLSFGKQKKKKKILLVLKTSKLKPITEKISQYTANHG